MGLNIVIRELAKMIQGDSKERDSKPVLNETCFENGKGADVVAFDLTQLPYQRGGDECSVADFQAWCISTLSKKLAAVVEGRDGSHAEVLHVIFVADGKYVCPAKQITQQKRSSEVEKHPEEYATAMASFSGVESMTADTKLPKNWNLILKADRKFRARLLQLVSEAIQERFPMTEHMVLTYVTKKVKFVVTAALVDVPRDPMSPSSTIKMTPHTFTRHVERNPDHLYFPKLGEADQYLLIAIKRVLDKYRTCEGGRKNVLLVSTDGDMVYNSAACFEFNNMGDHARDMQMLQTMVPSQKKLGAPSAGAGSGAGSEVQPAITYFDLTASWRSMRTVFEKWGTRDSVINYCLFLMCGGCDFVVGIKGITCTTWLKTVKTWHERGKKAPVFVVDDPSFAPGAAFIVWFETETMKEMIGEANTRAAGWTTRNSSDLAKGRGEIYTMMATASLAMTLALNNNLDSEGNHIGAPDCFSVDAAGLPVFGFVKTDSVVQRFVYPRDYVRSRADIGIGKRKEEGVVRVSKKRVVEDDDEDEDSREPKKQMTEERA